MLSRVAARSYSSASIKLTAREAAGNLSSVSVVINNAGSKAGKSGLSHLYSKFNFLNTNTRSALRFTRESELLGGIFSSKVTRDAVVLNTQFLKADLPYYVEALGNTLANPAFRPHELTEVVLPSARAEYEAASSDASFVGLEALHELSFRRGLGNPLYYDGTQSISVDEIRQFSTDVVKASNVSIFASGVNEADLTQFIGESALSQLPSGASATIPVEFFNGSESRIRKAGESAALIGVPVKTGDFGKYESLSVAIGNQTIANPQAPLSQIPGASSHLYKYADAGLFVVSVRGSGAEVAQGIKQAKAAVDAVSSADVSKATELSIALQSTFENPLSFKPSADKVKLDKFNYVAVGDVDALPYASEL
jgi:ubiquinol-cytochrome c reductase core subunit 2